MEDKGSTAEEIKLNDNGVWTNNELAIPNLISEFMRVWLEDNVPQDLIDGASKSKGQYTEEKQAKIIEAVYSKLINNRREEFEALLKLKDKKEVKDEQ